MRLGCLLLCCLGLHAVEVQLRSPLTTVVAVPCAGATGRLRIELEVPPGVPADLGCGVHLADHDGHWWQAVLLPRLTPGRHVRSVALAAIHQAEPPPATWAAMRQPVKAGVHLWSAAASTARIGVSVSVEAADAAARPGILAGLRPGPARLAVGERYELSVRPDPLPADPYDPDVFDLRLRITGPDGAERTVAGFLREPMASSDRGDREDMRADGPLAYACRWRPRLPGRHRLELSATWADGRSVRAALPEVVAAGAPATGIVGVDAADPRFLAVDGRLWWPVGLNLHSPFDLRSRDAIGTRLTPARGTRTYTAMLDRLAAAGGNATEIWLSSWNLGLQWRADWPGFAGLGGINLANAERLDDVLDHAWRRGIRVLPVVNNHGQASPRADREWKDNPLNAVHGGPCATPAEVFAHPGALAAQDRVRRYIVARWADHPAVWGWKMWSEIDLTAGVGEPMRLWHEQATARWRALDPSGRLPTTHWAGDYRRVDHAIAALPGVGFLCLDAYRRGKADQDPTPLVDILSGSINDQRRGLGRFAKPVVVTEYGAGSGESPEDFRAVDHQTGAWIALVSGHASAPMLWWWEWVDQGGRWAPYGAIQAFVRGEDLRGADASSIALPCDGAAQKLWCRAWMRPGRALGYVLDAAWGARGGTPTPVVGAVVRVAEQVAAGRLRLSWWDADAGGLLVEEEVRHPGGPLALTAPEFRGHAAWKLERLEDENGR